MKKASRINSVKKKINRLHPENPGQKGFYTVLWSVVDNSRYSKTARQIKYWGLICFLLWETGSSTDQKITLFSSTWRTPRPNHVSDFAYTGGTFFTDVFAIHVACFSASRWRTSLWFIRLDSLLVRLDSKLVFMSCASQFSFKLPAIHILTLSLKTLIPH